LKELMLVTGKKVSRTVMEHIKNPNNNPLLIFPEGVCVNNEYCVMFKKGAFELGAQINPVSIKYNKIFVDAFWNSKKQSFVRHIIRIMTSWALVCDVRYLPGQHMEEGENPISFASRVKALIASKAKLINVPWDGFLKYVQPNKKFLEHRQQVFAERLISHVRILDPALSQKLGLTEPVSIIENPAVNIADITNFDTQKLQAKGIRSVSDNPEDTQLRKRANTIAN